MSIVPFQLCFHLRVAPTGLVPAQRPPCRPRQGFLSFCTRGRVRPAGRSRQAVPAAVRVPVLKLLFYRIGNAALHVF